MIESWRAGERVRGEGYLEESSGWSFVPGELWTDTSAVVSVEFSSEIF